MKEIRLVVSCVLLFLFSSIFMNAQSKLQDKGKIELISSDDEEEGPTMFKFEPDYLLAIERRREEMAQTKQIIDTLDISENKRKKLLKDLYKNGFSKRLSKALITDTGFEDIEN